MTMYRPIKPNRLSFVIMPLLLALFILSACGGGDEEPPATAVPAPTDTAVVVTPTPEPEPTATPTVVEEATVGAEEESYPAPVATEPPVVRVAPEDYPAPGATTASSAADSYPAPVTPTPETSRIPIVPFVLERPLEAGDTLVRGTGPANVPIVIANIFLMGEVLGEGVIDADGNFEIEVEPIESGHWIGVALNELEGTEFTFEDFYAQGFRGEGAAQVPQVGFVYDSIVIP